MFLNHYCIPVSYKFLFFSVTIDKRQNFYKKYMILRNNTFLSSVEIFHEKSGIVIFFLFHLRVIKIYSKRNIHN